MELEDLAETREAAKRSRPSSGSRDASPAADAPSPGWASLIFAAALLLCSLAFLFRAEVPPGEGWRGIASYLLQQGSILFIYLALDSTLRGRWTRFSLKWTTSSPNLRRCSSWPRRRSRW